MTTAQGDAPVTSDHEGANYTKNNHLKSTAVGDRHDVVGTARRLAEDGFAVIAVHGVGPDGLTCSCPKGRTCRHPGKHPIGDGWQDCDGTIETFEATVGRRARFNVGILPALSGVLVIDVDPRNGGAASMAALKAEHGALPKSKAVRTGSGGYHVYYRRPEGIDFRGTLGRGIDLKTSGMVVAEGSRSHAGEYSVLVDAPIADPPNWLVELGRRPEPTTPTTEAAVEDDDDLVDGERDRRLRYCKSAIEAEVARLDAMTAAKTADGTGYRGEPWDQTTFDAACSLLEIANTTGSGLTADEAAQLVRDHAPRDAGFDDVRVEEKIESARRKVGTKGRTIPAAPVDPFPAKSSTTTSTTKVSAATSTSAATALDDDAPKGEAHSGQVRMAYRLAREHGDNLMHVYGLGWHRWTGTHYAPDRKGHAEKAVLDTLDRALAQSRGDAELRKDVGKCESASGITGVLAIGKALAPIATAPEEINADPHLLNHRGGTLDLRTMESHPHDPADKLTKCAGAAYVPDIDQTVWEGFLAEILPDADERAYLQRVVGLSLVGTVTEHLFPVLTGIGGNGKGTVYEAIVNALGDYALIIDPALLMASESGKAGGPELLQLMGARFVVGSETADGRSLDEATMKRLTGGDRLTARNLYQPPVTWVPSHQLVYVTNHLPKVKGNDPAVWRRMRVVPFDVVIPDEKKDTGLKDRLDLHREAVLAWAVEGYLDYREGGMREPATVRAATAAYQQESDAVARFVTEDCLISPAATATTREIFAAWERWARRAGANQVPEQKFGKELERLGYESKRTKRGKVWAGLAPYVTEGGDGG